MFEKVKFKRGDTFLAKGIVRLPDPVKRDRHGSPLMVETDIAGWSIRAQARNGDKLVAEFEAEHRPDISKGAYTLKCLDTSAWPVQSPTFAFDVEYTLPDGQVFHTRDIAIDCIKSKTI